MKITVCPKCGSKNISMGTMGSGVTFGITSWTETCRDCGYQGQPLLFESEKEYKKFLVDIKKLPNDKDNSPEEKLSIEEQIDDALKDTKKDKQVVELLSEFEKEKACKPVWPENKKWWPEIAIAFIFSALSMLFLYNSLLSIGMDMIPFAVFLISFYFLAVVSSLVSIVIIEYFIRYIIKLVRT